MVQLTWLANSVPTRDSHNPRANASYEYGRGSGTPSCSVTSYQGMGGRRNVTNAGILRIELAGFLEWTKWHEVH